jgi:hypothetical protein
MLVQAFARVAKRLATGAVVDSMLRLDALPVRAVVVIVVYVSMLWGILERIRVVRRILWHEWPFPKPSAARISQTAAAGSAG